MRFDLFHLICLNEQLRRSSFAHHNFNVVIVQGHEVSGPELHGGHVKWVLVKELRDVSHSIKKNFVAFDEEMWGPATNKM